MKYFVFPDFVSVIFNLIDLHRIFKTIFIIIYITEIVNVKI